VRASTLLPSRGLYCVPVNHKLSVDHNQRIILDVLTGLFTFMTLISLGGFIGCLARNLPLTRIYSWVNWILFLTSLAAGAIGIYEVFREHAVDSNKYTNCLNKNGGKEDVVTKTKCQIEAGAFSILAKALVTAMFVVYWLITVCASRPVFILSVRPSLTHCTDGCHIVSSYVSQLDEEDAAEQRYTRVPNLVNIPRSNIPGSDNMELYGTVKKDTTYYA
jgi:hypothetical protein